MKVALEDRGWFENKDYRSPCFDLKWTCKSTDAYSTALNENQVLIGEFREIMREKLGNRA
jgi:hypothetical protein